MNDAASLDRFFNAPLAETDPELAAAIGRELARQQDGIELIASENIVSRAVLEALFGVKTAFARTAKYAIGERAVNLEARKYRRRSGWLPYVEILVGCYFAFMIVFAVQTMNYFATPFLALFVFGYWWAGFGTLYQEYQVRLRWLKQRRLELAGQGMRQA